jgi:hypothetical protein
MKPPLASAFLVTFALSPLLHAADKAGGATASPAGAAFERIKSLAGTWTGKGITEGGPNNDVTIVYKVTAGGSTVEETLFPGTPHEMITMYHRDGDAVVLTHYCAFGNQPQMRLEPAKEPNVLSFRFSGGSNMKESDPHMHAVRLTFVDADHLKSSWDSMQDGKATTHVTFDLARKK